MPSTLSPSRLLPLLAWSLALCALESRAAVPVAVEASHGVVVSSQHLASQVGVDILKAGGNAVDAAVAVGYAEAVTNPCCANIGGGGFMVVHLAESRRDVFVNFRETAPQAATAAMFLDADGNPIRGASLDGYLAVAVPGTVLGLDSVLKRYGTLPRAVVMAPAIKLARDGFILTRGDTDIIDAGITEQAPWGAAELIALPEAAPRAMQMPSGNDSAVSGQMLPGCVYGAHDDRRPAGAAVGF
jgi:gamma-glutamyltranspeptidase / glutathione hydrolase